MWLLCLGHDNDIHEYPDYSVSWINEAPGSPRDLADFGAQMVRALSRTLIRDAVDGLCSEIALNCI